jgi:hypothetical protein
LPPVRPPLLYTLLLAGKSVLTDELIGGSREEIGMHIYTVVERAQTELALVSSGMEQSRAGRFSDSFSST